MFPELPSWVLSVIAFATAALLMLRLRRERRRSLAVALLPAFVWLGMVYIFVQFNLFGLGDAALRAHAVRPAILLLLLAQALGDVTALWRLRRLDK